MMRKRARTRVAAHPLLRPGHAGHVWIAPVLGGASRSLLLADLDEDERRRAGAFVREQDADAYITAHALARQALHRVSPSIPPRAWRFDRDANDRPVPAPSFPDLSFSLSHSSRWVAVAVSDDDACGIDVECAERQDNFDALAATVLSVAERAVYHRTEPGAARRRHFLRLWTLKECYAKARGLGLRLPFDALDCRLDLISLVDRTLADEPVSSWQFTQWSIGRDALAVAFRRTTGTTMPVVIHAGPLVGSIERPPITPTRGQMTTDAKATSRSRGGTRDDRGRHRGTPSMLLAGQAFSASYTPISPPLPADPDLRMY